MKRANFKKGLIFLATCTLTFVAHADDPPRLAHNPFTRPPSAATIPPRSLREFDSTALPLDLRATLVGTNDKLANVAGKVIRPGDEVDGYTLLQVFEDRAVFRKAGDRLTIYVKPDPEENDE